MNNDIDVLARTIYGEAKAHSTRDAIAIANVVINRCKLRNWPSTPAEVCQQPHQFSCWNPNDPNRMRILNASGDWFEKCKLIAADAVNGVFADDITNRATHYCTPAVKPKTYWAKNKTPCFETDGHVFFNDIDTPPPASAKEALDQARPINQSRTVRGATLAGAMTVIGPLASDVADTLEQYSYLSSYIQWACVVLGAVGAGYAIWARISDRQAGVN